MFYLFLLLFTLLVNKILFTILGITLASQPVLCLCLKALVDLTVEEHGLYRCDQFYFGNPEIPLFGKCERCSCNNNSMECNDRNGACLNCMFNTTGVNCELCVPGTFGNASNQDCRGKSSNCLKFHQVNYSFALHPKFQLLP